MLSRLALRIIVATSFCQNTAALAQPNAPGDTAGTTQSDFKNSSPTESKADFKVDSGVAQKGFLDGAGQNASHYDKNALHRLDFAVSGTGCAVCLFGLQKKLANTPGVVKAAVMLKNPYGASVIYDANQTSKDRLLDVASHHKKGVVVKNSQDKAIAAMPLVLIPPPLSAPGK